MRDREVFDQANKLYWDRIEALTSVPWTPHRYDMVEFVRQGKWHPLMNMMVSDELQETINLVHGWGLQLVSWTVWIEVLATFEDFNDRWTLRMQHVDNIAFVCLYQAASMRDRLTFIATNAIHQGNLASVPGCVDRLPLDDLASNRFASRRRKENQLFEIASRWKSSKRFHEKLVRLNDAEYRKITRDFRNRSSHAIGPRFEFGETSFVTRSLEHPENTVEQPDGSYRLVKDTTRKVPQYAFGGPPALKYDEMLAASQGQHDLARNAIEAYEVVLGEILTKIGLASHDL
jgi:hypothetical protein